MKSEQNTEQKIIEAAENIFHSRGYEGARMQEIAEEAGINKGLLHYYFKTKNKLFEKILDLALQRMLIKIQTILDLDVPLEQKISLVVDQYITFLLKAPQIPLFIVNELNKNSDRFIQKYISKDIRRSFEGFTKAVQKEVDANTIQNIDGRQLFINLMSLLIFPFIGRPLLQVITAANKTEFNQLLEERRQHVKTFIHSALRK